MPQKLENKNKLPVPGENGAKFRYFALDFYFEQSLVRNSGARNRDFRVLRYKHTNFFQRVWHAKTSNSTFLVEVWDFRSDAQNVFSAPNYPGKVCFPLGKRFCWRPGATHFLEKSVKFCLCLCMILHQKWVFWAADKSVPGKENRWAWGNFGC